MKNSFFSFFKNSKCIFLTSERIFSNPNEIIKFISTKTRNLFFNFSYRKPQHMCIYFIINLQKKYENGGVPSRVLNSGNPAVGLALSRVGFGLLQLFQGWTTLKAPKLFPTVVHVGLVGHLDPHPLQATNGKGLI